MESKVIREYIAEQLQAQKLGAIHSRNRLPKDKKTFRELFEYDGRIQAWIVTRVGIGDIDDSASFLKIPETFLVITFVGFSDTLDTETLFETNVNTVYTMLSRNRTLGGHVANVTSVTVPEISLVYIGEILSHYAEVVVEVEEYIE